MWLWDLSKKAVKDPHTAWVTVQVSFPNLWASGAYLIAVSTGYSLPLFNTVSCCLTCWKSLCEFLLFSELFLFFFFPESAEFLLKGNC